MKILAASQAISRRSALTALLAAPLLARAEEAGLVAALRAGGGVMVFRHALAPGTFDPPNFRVGDCGTQRNLNEVGREQARRIGAWFRARGLQPSAVRSSPWCRCLDTATLAFGSAEPWAALGSPRAGTEQTNAGAMAALRQALVEQRQRPGFEVWVSHMFVISPLTGRGVSSGEGLLLRAGDDGRVQVVETLATA